MSRGAPGPPAIELVEVVKLFDGGLVRALDGVTMHVQQGEFLAITGPSGCGKSTLLHLVAALDVPTAGAILVNGRDLRSLAQDVYRRNEVGLIFQLHNLLPHLSVLENVEVAMFSNGLSYSQQRRKARELLEEVGLAEKAAIQPPRLAGGERQRLAIARALANSPSVILADEPTGNLDSASTERVLALFRRIRDARSVAIVLVTHDRQVAAAAHRVVQMRDGRVVEDTAGSRAGLRIPH